MKACTRCGVSKEETIEFFSKHSQTLSRLHPWCRSCHKEYARVQREKDPFQITLSKVKNRSKDKGLPFNLTKSHLASIWSGVCPVFNIPIYLNSTGCGYALSNSASLDRMQPTEGYTVGNVVWISNRANLIKQDATSDEVMKVALWMKENNL